MLHRPELRSRGVWRARLRAPLASLLVVASLLALSLPQSVDAQPRPLPSDRSSKSGKSKPQPIGGDERGRSEEVKCMHCYMESAPKIRKCYEDMQRCSEPCPACRAPGDCERREKCSAPCLKKYNECNSAADKEFKACMRGC